MTESQRLIVALLLLSVYIIWVAHVIWQYRRTQSHSAHSPASQLLITYASQTGSAQALAENLAIEKGNQQIVSLVPLSALKPEDLLKVEQAIFVVSTYGHGEPPDNGRSFYKALKNLNDNTGLLTHLHFDVIALGDSSYPHFCAFGEYLQHRLSALGATPLSALTRYDRQKDDITAVTTLAHQQVPFTSFVVSQRRQLNSGREHPLFEVVLTSKDKHFTWQAGDILDVLPENNANHAPRSYTIASLHSSGVVRLIIRLAVTAEGKAGLASGWLTQQCNVGDLVQARLHTNPVCHLSLNHKPALLIGAGSGLAGVRSQWLRLVESHHNGPITVIYGERNPLTDQVLEKVIPHHLIHADNVSLTEVFSRCPDKPMYVQQALQQQRSIVLDVLNAGGQIYVCGSYEGMGEGIHHVLIEQLGEAAVQQLIDNHRYHRDVY